MNSYALKSFRRSTRTIKTAIVYALVGLCILASLPCSANAQTATLLLGWTPPNNLSGITHYRIYVRPASGAYDGTYYSVAGAQSSSLAINNIAPGSYVFKATSYDSSSALESSPSNETAGSVFLTALEGLTSAAQLSGRTFRFKAFSVGGATPLVDVSATANGAGLIAIPTGASALSANFDLLLSSTSHLSKRQNNRSRSDTNALPMLPAGNLDLDSPGTINSFDYNVLKANWGGANATADINRDGIVNGFDYNYLKRNWFLSSDQ